MWTTREASITDHKFSEIAYHNHATPYDTKSVPVKIIHGFVLFALRVIDSSQL